MNNKFSLVLHQIKCIDETGGRYREKIGNDEIYLGGFTISEQGTIIKIPAFSVYPHFDDGDVKVYQPPKVFFTFPLNESNSWPKTFIAGLVLIEADHKNALTRDIEKVADLADKYIAKQLPDIAVKLSVMPSPFPSVPIPDDFLKSFFGVVKNNVFSPQLVTARLGNPESENVINIKKTIYFTGYSGHYSLEYSWSFAQ